MPVIGLEPRWTLAANVRLECFHGEGGDVRPGTKHFSGATKVFYKSAYWGMGGEQVTVIGLHRRSRSLITVAMPARHLHRWRAVVVDRPAVLQRLADGWSEEHNPDDWEQLAQSFDSSRHCYAFERTASEADAVSGSWHPRSRLLAALRAMSSTRAAIAYLDDPSSPIGIGKLDSQGVSHCWVQPDYHHVGADQKLRTRLTHAPSATPPGTRSVAGDGGQPLADGQPPRAVDR